MRSLSSAALASVNAHETGEVWLTLAKLTHPNWGSPVYLVNNTEDVTHQGQVYTAFPFMVNLPDEVAEGLPVLQFLIDNTSLELMDEFRSIASQSGYVDVQIGWIIASSPDTLEIGWLDLEMRSVQYDANRIVGTLSVEPILDAQFGIKTFTPTTAPALF